MTDAPAPKKTIKKVQLYKVSGKKIAYKFTCNDCGERNVRRSTEVFVGKGLSMPTWVICEYSDCGKRYEVISCSSCYETNKCCRCGGSGKPKGEHHSSLVCGLCEGNGECIFCNGKEQSHSEPEIPDEDD